MRVSHLSVSCHKLLRVLKFLLNKSYNLLNSKYDSLRTGTSKIYLTKL